MKKNFLLFIICLSFKVASSQKHVHYLVMRNNDTVDFKFNFIRNNARLNCDINGKTQFVKPKKVKQICMHKKVYYESGKVGGRWLYLRMIEKGTLSLLSMKVLQKSLGSSGTMGTYNSTTVLFGKSLKQNPDKAVKLHWRWRKNLKKLVKDCPEVLARVNTLKFAEYSVDLIAEISNEYNSKCGR